jgi:hypothetical protein
VTTGFTWVSTVLAAAPSIRAVLTAKAKAQRRAVAAQGTTRTCEVGDGSGRSSCSGGLRFEAADLEEVPLRPVIDPYAAAGTFAGQHQPADS